MLELRGKKRVSKSTQMGAGAAPYCLSNLSNGALANTWYLPT